MGNWLKSQKNILNFNHVNTLHVGTTLHRPEEHSTGENYRYLVSAKQNVGNANRAKMVQQVSATFYS